VNQLILTVTAAVLPAIILVVYFWKSDRFPEPPGVLFVTFLLGIFSIIPAALIALPFQMGLVFMENPYLYGIYQAFFVAAIPEETAKFLIIFYYCYKHHAFDEAMDGLVYGATASLGFAALENILYVSNYGYSVAITRALTSIPCHAFFGMFIGYYLGVYKLAEVKKRSIILKGMAIAILLHGIYDVPLLMLNRIRQMNYPSTSTFHAFSLLASWAIIIATYRIAWRKIRRSRREQERSIDDRQFEEIAEGLKKKDSDSN
jgi:protease PrsW